MDPRCHGGEGSRAAPGMDAICAALELRSGRIWRLPPELGETGDGRCAPPCSPTAASVTEPSK
jgi:hypothetical protein